MIEWYWLALMMVFAHIVEDFHIQGLLAELKQKSYWRMGLAQNNPYARDYIPALVCHGIEWSFIVHIPLMFAYGLEPIIFVMILVNAGIHAIVDHEKCNEHTINLIQDQLIHLLQIASSLTIVSLVVWLL